MKFCYNIQANFKKDLINFYEWESSDNIECIKKIPVFKINDKLINLISSNNIIFNDSFISKINYDIDNSIPILFCSNYDSICVIVNKNGRIELFSKLTLDDEENVLEYTSKFRFDNIQYTISNISNSYSFETRKEKEIIKSISEKISVINDEKTIEYLYYEWFNKQGKKDLKNKLLNSISSKYTKRHNNFYDVIKLLSCNNV